MARLPARVDWIVHQRTDTRVALRLNKKSMTFQATYGGVTVRDTDGSKVHSQIMEMIERVHALTWVPAIEVEVLRQDTKELEARVEVALERFFYAQDDDKLFRAVWEKCQHGAPDTMRKWKPSERPAVQFSLPYTTRTRYTYGRDYFYLPYSDGLWSGLKELIDTINMASARISELLDDPGVVERIALAGAGILPRLITGGEETGNVVS